MAEIAPFRGIRYNKKMVDLNKVTSQPYDVISPEEKECYLQLHPNNFVRLILGEERDTDSDADNRFTRAKTYLEDWITSGILMQDAKPSIYIYKQEFERDGKLNTIYAFTVAVRLHDYSDKVILPHENTLAKPKSHLVPLLNATRANLDSVYGLYADEQRVLDTVMNRIMMSSEADADVREKDGARHQLWVLSDPEDIRQVVDFMKDKPIAIADGHHRYETALSYAKQVREKCSCAHGCNPASDFVLMTLANVYQKDMTIFPTHRVVDNLSQEILGSLSDRLSELFDIEHSTKSNLIEDMKRRRAIGMYSAKEAKTIKLKRDPGSLLEGSNAGRHLELNVLHKLVLEPMLGIDKDKLRDQSHIIYTRDAEEAMSLVDSGQKQIAFLLNNIDVKAVLDIASAGEKMPQKATYFYPKLLSGLVLRKMD